MRYTPYTEAEIQSMNVMDEGTYKFEIIEVHTVDRYNAPLVDKNGVDMAKLKLMVLDNQNRERTLFTFISGDGKFAYKLRHLAKAIGMMDAYEDGTFDIKLALGKTGMADIVIKKGTLKLDGSGEMWADRNDVKDFVSEPTQAQVTAKPPASSTGEDLEDDIPF